MRFLTYDPNTGEILGRIVTTDKQAAHYPVKRELSAEEYDERPELFLKVDLADPKKQLVALSETEAKARGASDEFIAQKIAEGKIAREGAAER
jgi:hypothetical protein